MTSCVVVAAGKGERFGGPVPKVFADFCGSPLVEHCLGVLQRSRLIDELVLVLPARWVRGAFASSLKRTYPRLARVVAGGACREASVFNGLRACSPGTTCVLVHDGARPLVSGRLVARVVRAALRHGAAVPVLPVHESLRRVRGGCVTGVFPREGVFSVQTPQGFRAEILRECMERFSKELAEFSDESSMLLRAGIPVRAVKGEASNVKVTTRGEARMCESMRARREVRREDRGR